MARSGSQRRSADPQQSVEARSIPGLPRGAERRQRRPVQSIRHCGTPRFAGVPGWCRRQSGQVTRCQSDEYRTLVAGWPHEVFRWNRDW